MKINECPIKTLDSFHKDLVKAKTKANVIDLLCERGSSQGWFSNMPDGLFEKLQGMRLSMLQQNK